MIETIITDYLQHNRRLVIPELGAFLKKEGGETVFVPFLNKDDGVLTGLVRQTYGTSTAEAEGIIAQYAENVRQGIARNRAYLMAPLGSLKRDTNGMLFLDAADQTARQAVKEAVVEEPDGQAETVVEEVAIETPDVESKAVGEDIPAYIPPVVTPEPEPAKTVGESIDAPKTLNDLIRERQEQSEAPATLHERMVEAPKPPQRPVVRPAPRPVSHPAPRKARPAPAAPSKRGDWVLIGAIVVAIVAVIALIYSYIAVDLPVFNLR